MEKLEIKDPEDWYYVQKQLRNMIKRFPEFVFDYNKIHNNIEVKIRDLCLIDIQIKRNKDSIYYQQLRKDKLSEINQTIKAFSKILLVATLAKR